MNTTTTNKTNQKMKIKRTEHVSLFIDGVSIFIGVISQSPNCKGCYLGQNMSYHISIAITWLTCVIIVADCDDVDVDAIFCEIQ